ncbi:hypothetical protein BGW39_010313 [Mortierella sp. 14UC]|nr:hypothetical protein BGW39_010313 [Mortierella sp. 14UC]
MRRFCISIVLAALIIVMAASTQDLRLAELTGEAITSPSSRLSARATKDHRPLLLHKRELTVNQCNDLKLAAFSAALSISPVYYTLSKNFQTNNDPVKTAVATEAGEKRDLITVMANRKDDGRAPYKISLVTFVVQGFSISLKKLLEREIVSQADYDKLHESVQTYLDKISVFNKGVCHQYLGQ